MDTRHFVDIVEDVICFMEGECGLFYWISSFFALCFSANAVRTAFLQLVVFVHFFSRF